jgi:putative transposase
LYEKITNKRKDFNEKLSRTLVEQNDVICVESLRLQDMAENRSWAVRKDSVDKSNHGKSVNDLG